MNMSSVKAMSFFLSIMGAIGSASSETIKDGEDHEYTTVTIGTQTWLKENLRATKYRNGEAIGTTDPVNKDITSETTPKYQWPSKGTDSGEALYGRLYTWFAATDSRGICPVGWQVPSDAEWTTLTDYLGGVSTAGTKLKEAGSDHWQVSNTGDNSSGFTALPAGTREIIGTIGGMDQGFWTSTPFFDVYSKYRRVFGYKAEIYDGGTAQRIGYSVRCIQATEPEPTGLRTVPGSGVSGLKVFPAGADGTWTVEAVGFGTSKLDVRVVDFRGRILTTMSSREARPIRLELGSAPKGLYLVRVTDGIRTLTRGIVLE